MAFQFIFVALSQDIRYEFCKFVDRSSNGADDPRRGGAPLEFGAEEKKDGKSNKEGVLGPVKNIESKTPMRAKRTLKPRPEPAVDLLDFNTVIVEPATVCAQRFISSKLAYDVFSIYRTGSRKCVYRKSNKSWKLSDTWF